jgi:hypothetical protein
MFALHDEVRMKVPSIIIGLRYVAPALRFVREFQRNVLSTIASLADGARAGDVT